jgi:hypothetical protein
VALDFPLALVTAVVGLRAFERMITNNAATAITASNKATICIPLPLLAPYQRYVFAK